MSERGLTFVAIDLSGKTLYNIVSNVEERANSYFRGTGHEVPEYQPSAGYRTFEMLLGRIDSFSDTSPFTTQPGVKQPEVPLGQGNWWPSV